MCLMFIFVGIFYVSCGLFENGLEPYTQAARYMINIVITVRGGFTLLSVIIMPLNVLLRAG